MAVTGAEATPVGPTSSGAPASGNQLDRLRMQANPPGALSETNGPVYLA